MSKIKLNAEDIREVLTCPLLHHLNGTRRKPVSERRKEQLDEIVRITLKQYHQSLVDGEEMTAQDAILLMERLWYGDLKREDVLLSRQVKQKMPAAKEAGAWIEYYFRYRKKLLANIIDANVPFTVRVGDIQVSCMIDLVQEIDTGDGKRLELLTFTLAKRRPTDFYLRTHIDITLQSYAFRSLYKTKEDAIVVWWVPGGEAIETHRTPADFAKLKAQIEQAAWWAQAYPTPRYGIHCNACLFQDECLDWKPQTQKEDA